MSASPPQRKRSPPKSNTSSRGSNKRSAKGTAASAHVHSPSGGLLPQHPNPPLASRTLIVDNGGDTIKYGWADDETCLTIPNLTARLPQQLTVLVGDQIFSAVSNPNQCIITRSTERGMINNMGNQIQVWKRILDLLNVVIPPSETASAFGWKTTTAHHSKTGTSSGTRYLIPSHQVAVLLALPPFCPRVIIDHILMVWFQDFGVSSVGFCISTVVAARYQDLSLPKSTPQSNAEYDSDDDQSTSNDQQKESQVVEIACVVDLGWSAINIVPVYRGINISKNNDHKTIRRIPIGGRHLINIWKYHCSYRQFNMMDQDFVMTQVFCQTAQVAQNLDREIMAVARKIPPGRRPYDREFLLPDYQTTFNGTVRIPEAVLRSAHQNETSHIDEEEDENEESDEDFEEKDATEEDVELYENENDGGLEIADSESNHSDRESDEESGDEEFPEQIRERLLRQRAEEERRRKDIEAQQQVLHVSVERFAVPETLFRPSDAGLPEDWASLPVAIVQAIQACPMIYRAGLYKSVQLTGGLSQLPGLRERLTHELRALTPSKYGLRVSCSDTPVDQAWKGAQRLVNNALYSKCSICRDAWAVETKRGAWKSLLMAEGGQLI
jgi:actin-related protein